MPARRQRPPGTIAPPPAAFSYRSRRREPDQPANGAQDRLTSRSHTFGRRWLHNRTVAVTGLLLVLATALFWVTLTSHVTLKTETSAPLLRPASTYQAVADAALQAEGVRAKFKPTLDTASLRSRLLQSFPELQDVRVTLPLTSRRPLVHIVPAQPAFIVLSRTGSFVIDTQGKAIASQGSLAEVARGLPVVTDQSGLPAQLNHPVLSSASTAFILTVLAQLQAAGLKSSQITLPPAASEVDIHLAGQPYLVKFNMQRGQAREQAGTLLATQAQLVKQHITPQQYIDVRVEGRAYYQ